MKARTMIGIGAAAIWLTSTGFSDQYDDLVKKGYRWVTTDGPFACRSKEDVQRLINNQSDENRLRMLSQGGVYYLIRGVIVQVVQEDKASGLSQVHWDGIAANLWTPSTFLSKHPVTNILGTIATPSQPIGVIKSDVNAPVGRDSNAGRKRDTDARRSRGTWRKPDALNFRRERKKSCLPPVVSTFPSQYLLAYCS